jgi:hypothetical protein
MLILAFAVLSGCSDTCAPPQPELNEKVWSVFVQPTSFTIDGEGFPAESTPANGTHEWIVSWTTPDPESAVVVTIDGQPFDGTGRWSTQECGNFDLGFNGIFAGDDGSNHSFAASAELATWPGHLEGFLDWRETWALDGVVGSYSTEAQLFGSN